MPQGNTPTRTRGASPASRTQPPSGAGSTRDDVPPVGTADAQVPQPTASQSRDHQISELARNPLGRSGRPSGPDGLKHDGTREAKRVSREGTSQEESPTTRTRTGAAGLKTNASTPATADTVGSTRTGKRVATEATAGRTGLRPEGARGGHNRTPTRSDTPASRSTGRTSRDR
jgi:hypothetical protein